MSVLIIPLFAVAFVLLVIMLIMLISKLRNSEERKFLVIGLFLSIIEIISLLLFFKSKTEVYVFSPAFNVLVLFIIIPAIISILLSIPDIKISRKIGGILVAKVVITSALILFYNFVISNYFSVFELLDIKTTKI